MRTKPRREPNGFTPQRAWPMVEAAAADRSLSTTRQSSEVDAQEHAEALRAEARSGLVRAGSPPPSLDRELARALVEAGYMPLSDYVALYGDGAGQRTPNWSLSVAARFTVAVPRRNVYRATSVRYSLPKPSEHLLASRRRA